MSYSFPISYYLVLCFVVLNALHMDYLILPGIVSALRGVCQMKHLLQYGHHSKIMSGPTRFGV